MVLVKLEFLFIVRTLKVVLVSEGCLVGVAGWKQLTWALVCCVSYNAVAGVMSSTVFVRWAAELAAPTAPLHVIP